MSKIVRVLMINAAIACLLVVGCGDDSNESDVSCTTVCDAIEAQCSHDNPDCESQCTAWSAARKKCIVNAASCIQGSECQ